jgi:hypothetical protein
MRFRARRTAAPDAPDAPGAPVVPPGLPGRDRDIGDPAAESQQAGLDHLRRIALEQAAGGASGVYRHI